MAAATSTFVALPPTDSAKAFTPSSGKPISPDTGSRLSGHSYDLKVSHVPPAPLVRFLLNPGSSHTSSTDSLPPLPLGHHGPPLRMPPLASTAFDRRDDRLDASSRGGRNIRYLTFPPSLTAPDKAPQELQTCLLPPYWNVSNNLEGSNYC